MAAVVQVVLKGDGQGGFFAMTKGGSWPVG